MEDSCYNSMHFVKESSTAVLSQQPSRYYNSSKPQRTIHRRPLSDSLVKNHATAAHCLWIFHSRPSLLAKLSSCNSSKPLRDSSVAGLFQTSWSKIIQQKHTLIDFHCRLSQVQNPTTAANHIASSAAGTEFFSSQVKNLET
jgi:hypothetical protein